MIMENNSKYHKVIEMEVEPLYKIPEGYHVEFENDGRTLMLWKDRWLPKDGEVYYEPMSFQYKPVKKACKFYDNFKDRVVFKTERECREWCKTKNSLMKRWFNQLIGKEE